MSTVIVKAQRDAKQAEGEALAKKTLADAHLYEKQQEAAGIAAMWQAQAHGMDQMLKACDNQPPLLQFWLANEKNLFVEMLKQSSKAVRKMEPKVNIWHHSDGSNTNNAASVLRDLVKVTPPMLDYLDQMLPGLNLTQTWRSRPTDAAAVKPQNP